MRRKTPDEAVAHIRDLRRGNRLPAGVAITDLINEAGLAASVTAGAVHGFLEDLRSLDITVDDESSSHVLEARRTPATSQSDLACCRLSLRRLGTGRHLTIPSPAPQATPEVAGP